MKMTKKQDETCQNCGENKALHLGYFNQFCLNGRKFKPQNHNPHLQVKEGVATPFEDTPSVPSLPKEEDESEGTHNQGDFNLSEQRGLILAMIDAKFKLNKREHGIVLEVLKIVESGDEFFIRRLKEEAKKEWVSMESVLKSIDKLAGKDLI